MGNFNEYYTFFLFGLFLISFLIFLRAHRNGYYAQPHAKISVVFRYARVLCPILFILFFVRAFVFDFALVPTSSMWPNVRAGEFILVRKDYGVFFRTFSPELLVKFFSPKRSDAVIFLYPPDESLIYLKRIVALPGEEITYDSNKHISIKTTKGLIIDYRYTQPQKYPTALRELYSLRERTPSAEYRLAVINQLPALSAREIENFSKDFQGQCARRSESGFICKVPEGHFFMMGDNRDQSLDSRYWGMVRKEKIIARAVLVCNFNALTDFKWPGCHRL